MHSGNAVKGGPDDTHGKKERGSRKTNGQKTTRKMETPNTKSYSTGLICAAGKGGDLLKEKEETENIRRRSKRKEEK